MMVGEKSEKIIIMIKVIFGKRFCIDNIVFKFWMFLIMCFVVCVFYGVFIWRLCGVDVW